MLVVTRMTSSEMPNGSVSVETLSPQGVLVRVDGDLDMALAPALAGAITGAIADGHRHVAIDLGHASFMDCASVRALFASLAPLSDDPQARVVLAGPHGVVSRMLTLLEVDRMVEVVGDAARVPDRLLRDPQPPLDGWRRLARSAAAEERTIRPS